MNANEGTTPDMGWEAQIDAVAIKTDLDEIKSWINDGKLMPAHKVRMKNLTWIEAGKVPAFQKLFEQKANALAAQNTKATVSVSQTGRLNSPVPSTVFTENVAPVSEAKQEPAEPSVAFKLYEQKLLAKSKSAENPAEKVAEKPKRTSPKPKGPERPMLQQPKPKAGFRGALLQMAGFVVGCALAFLLAWGGAFLWVYQFSSPVKIDEKSVTELIVLEQKLITDKVSLRLNLANSGQADSVDINVEFSKLDKELERQKKLILDQHRIKLKENDFNRTFYGSFVILLIAFVVLRIVFGGSGKAEPTPATPRASAKSKANSDGEANDDGEPEILDGSGVSSSDSELHVTSAGGQHTTTSPNAHSTNQPNTFTSLDDYMNSPEYLEISETDKGNRCLVHKTDKAEYFCVGCSNYFCAECPKPVGEASKCCPFCKLPCTTADFAAAGIHQTMSGNGTGKPAKPKPKPEIEFTIYDFAEEKTRKVSFISAFFIALCLSGPIAYFWVYEISPRLYPDPVETAKLETNTDPKAEAPNANTNANVAKPAAVPSPAGTPEPCIDPQTQTPFECDEETRRALTDHTAKTKSVADAQKQVDEKVNLILSIIPGATPTPDPNAEVVEAPPVVEDPAVVEKREADKKRFYQIFIGSFLLIFCGLISTRFFMKD